MGAACRVEPAQLGLSREGLSQCFVLPAVLSSDSRRVWDRSVTSRWFAWAEVRPAWWGEDGPGTSLCYGLNRPVAMFRLRRSEWTWIVARRGEVGHDRDCQLARLALWQQGADCRLATAESGMYEMGLSPGNGLRWSGMSLRVGTDRTAWWWLVEPARESGVWRGLSSGHEQA